MNKRSSMNPDLLRQIYFSEQKSQQSLSVVFSELRALCAEEDYEFPVIDRKDRPNPFGLGIANPNGT